MKNLTRLGGASGRSAQMALALTLGASAAALGCAGYDSASAEAVVDGGDDDEPTELGTSHQELSSFYSPFTFVSSCSDPKGTDSTMAALAVATATELKRWQPSKDFVSSGGLLKLTSTGKAQCDDGRCWNTQAILDLQNAPAGKVQIRRGVTLDPKTLKSELTKNMEQQLKSLSGKYVPEHKFQLSHSEPGGCDQLYWFNTTSPTGVTLTSFILSSLKGKLDWVGGKKNPYIQFQTDGTMVGIDPTYGLNEAGSSSSGSCTAACTKISSVDVSGTCCSCNGTKKFARSAWSTTTYLCQ